MNEWLRDEVKVGQNKRINEWKDAEEERRRCERRKTDTRLD